jgi:hypothetical protein
LLDADVANTMSEPLTFPQLEFFARHNRVPAWAPAQTFVELRPEVDAARFEAAFRLVAARDRNLHVEFANDAAGGVRAFLIAPGDLDVRFGHVTAAGPFVEDPPEARAFFAARMKEAEFGAGRHVSAVIVTFADQRRLFVFSLHHLLTDAHAQYLHLTRTEAAYDGVCPPADDPCWSRAATHDYVARAHAHARAALADGAARYWTEAPASAREAPFAWRREDNLRKHFRYETRLLPRASEAAKAAHACGEKYFVLAALGHAAHEVFGKDALFLEHFEGGRDLVPGVSVEHAAVYFAIATPLLVRVGHAAAETIAHAKESVRRLRRSIFAWHVASHVDRKSPIPPEACAIHVNVRSELLPMPSRLFYPRVRMADSNHEENPRMRPVFFHVVIRGSGLEVRFGYNPNFLAPARAVALLDAFAAHFAAFAVPAPPATAA